MTRPRAVRCSFCPRKKGLMAIRTVAGTWEFRKCNPCDGTGYRTGPEVSRRRK